MSDDLNREPTSPESDEERSERLATIGAFMERFGGLVAPGPARIETLSLPTPPGAAAVTALVLYTTNGAHVSLWTDETLEQAAREVLAALGVEIAEPPKLRPADLDDLRRLGGSLGGSLS